MVAEMLALEAVPPAVHTEAKHTHSFSNRRDTGTNKEAPCMQARATQLKIASPAAEWESREVEQGHPATLEHHQLSKSAVCCAKSSET
eukprot:1616136-Rhodomonas_salina.3